MNLPMTIVFRHDERRAILGGRLAGMRLKEQCAELPRELGFIDEAAARNVDQPQHSAWHVRIRNDRLLTGLRSPSQLPLNGRLRARIRVNHAPQPEIRYAAVMFLYGHEERSLAFDLTVPVPTPLDVPMISVIDGHQWPLAFDFRIPVMRRQQQLSQSLRETRIKDDAVALDGVEHMSPGARVRHNGPSLFAVWDGPLHRAAKGQLRVAAIRSHHRADLVPARKSRTRALEETARPARAPDLEFLDRSNTCGRRSEEAEYMRAGCP